MVKGAESWCSRDMPKARKDGILLSPLLGLILPNVHEAELTTVTCTTLYPYQNGGLSILNHQELKE